MNIDDAPLCLHCNYPLRGLPAPRCPECGNEFDPRDPWTMNLGRPMGKWARVFVKHPGAITRTATRLGWIGCFWGAAWLPGGYDVTMDSAFALAVLYFTRFVRAIVRIWILRRYRQPKEITGQPMRASWLTAIACLVLGFGNFEKLPVRITLLVCNQFPVERFHKIYAVDPAPAGPLPGLWCGIIYANGADVAGSGIYAYTENGTIFYSEEDDPNCPGGFRGRWELTSHEIGN